MRKSSQTSNQLTVGVDLRSLDPAFKAHFGRGTGRYGEELSRALLKVSGEDEIVALTSEDFALSSWKEGLLDLAPFGKQTLRNQLFLPQKTRDLFKEKHLSLLHFLSHGDAPAGLSKPYVVTVLDLIPLKFPELYKPKRMSWRFKLARYLELQVIKQAKGILAISETTKSDIVELLGYPEENVWVTPLALPEGFRCKIKEEEILARVRRDEWREGWGLNEEAFAICYVGGIDPRKNVLFLLDVFAKVVEAESDRDIFLILAGNYSQDEMLPKVLQRIKELNLEERVKMAGFLSDEALLELYQCSDLFAFPSLYEGFGFPVLEAFAAGLPVVAGRNSSIVEVAGDAALLLPDNDLEGWIWGIRSLIENKASRDDLAIAGRARLSKFSWERTAKDTMDAYRYFGGL